MNKNLFSKKLIDLRKKHHYTQQELADKLNVSNKTISRWETAESYPDIELLPILADIYHVSIDYLLSDHEDYQDIDKSDIVSYVPWIIGILGILVYYIFIKLGVPHLFAFIVYYFIVKFSYYFSDTYTDKKNYQTLTLLNTVSGFFVIQSFIFQILSIFYLFNVASSFFDPSTFDSLFINELSQFSMTIETFISLIIVSYIIAGIYAYFYYKKHNKSSSN